MSSSRFCQFMQDTVLFNFNGGDRLQPYYLFRKMAATLLARFSDCRSWSERTTLFEELLQSTSAKPDHLGPFIPYIQDSFFEEPLAARKLAYECAINLIIAIPAMLDHFKSSFIVALQHEKVYISRTALNFLPRIVATSMNDETSTALLEAATVAVKKSPNPEACSMLALAVSAASGR